MKKCSSCTKDLPDAALHCVFCGAKQPPAPAVAGGAAKTVMGHGSQEMIEQLKAAQAQAARHQQQPPPVAPQPAPYSAPYSAPQPVQRPQPAPPMGGPMNAPMGGPMGAAPGAPLAPTMVPQPGQHLQPAPLPHGHGGHGVPPAGSVAPTMFVPGSGGGPAFQPGPSGPQPGFPPAPAPERAPPPQAPSPSMPPAPQLAPMPAPAPSNRVPGSPITPAAPYLQQRIGQERSGRPVEPWKDSLRFMMFLWGGILILAFVTPTAIEPDLAFHWDMIIDGEGTAKLGPLLIAAIGLLAVLLAIIPTSPPPRGLIAGVLGLAGFTVPIALTLGQGELELPQILILVSTVGMVLLLPGLLIRNEYRESKAGRIMATLGALCVIAMYVVPVNDKIGIVAIFEGIIDGEGALKIAGILELLPVVLAVLSLLVWLPAPSTGLAKIWAWSFMLLPLVVLLTSLIVKGDIGAAVKGSPYKALMAWAPVTAYYVLIAYGFATIIGKKLE